MLQDIAVLTGGTVITEEMGFKLESTTLDMLGRAEKVTKENTTIVNGNYDKKQSKLVLLKSGSNYSTTSDYDREKLGTSCKISRWCCSSLALVLPEVE